MRASASVSAVCRLVMACVTVASGDGNDALLVIPFTMP